MNSTANSPGSAEAFSIFDSLISPAQLKALNAGMLINEHPDTDELTLAPWFMASLSLPYRDPGVDLNAWERENGNMRITLSPYVYRGESLFPYGVIPRLLLTWMTTEAIRTRSPEIQISKTLNAFMQQTGIGRGGNQRRAVLDQMRRLFNSNIRIERQEDVEREGNELKHLSTQNFQFAEQHELWLKEENGAVSSIEWGSTVTLSPRFFESIKEHSFPIYTEALRALGNSPLRLDIYLFMVNRFFRLKRPTRISWDQLNAQFGGNYKQVRMFKRDFVKHLEAVSVIYPEAKYTLTDKVLMLFPSPQHVPSIPRNIQALEETQGDSK